MAIGQVTKKYVSSVSFLDKRDILNKVLDITNEQMSFLDVMELTGRTAATIVPQYDHFVNEEMYTTVTIDTAGAGAGTTNTRTLTLVAGDTDKLKSEGQLIYFKDKKVGRIQSKSGNDIVVKLVGPSSTFHATNTVADADVLSVFSNASGEGSGGVDSVRFSMTKYRNQVQIFKEAYEVTGIQKASQIEVEFGGKPYIMYKGQHDALLKFRGDISFAMLMGRISDENFGATSPTLTDADGNPIQTTKGLDQYVEDQGLDLTLAGASLALADFQSLTKKLNARRCPDQYLVFLGTNKNIQWDDMLNQLGNSATLSTAAQFQIGKNLDLGVESVKIYGRTYHKKYLPLLDHPQVTNRTNFTQFADTMYFVPNDKIKVDKGGEMVDRMRVRFMEGDGTNLKYVETWEGKFAPAGTNASSQEKSIAKVHYESVQGLEILGASHFAKLK
jgi:hypothetical protein